MLSSLDKQSDAVVTSKTQLTHNVTLKKVLFNCK